MKRFFAKIRWRPKKKIFAGNWSGFFPKLGEELGLFRLIIQCSNLVGGTLNLDGGTRPPYNLSAGLTPNKNSEYANELEIAWKKMLKNYFFWRTLAPVSLAFASSIPVLGLERVCPRKGCPWPWPRIFFVSLALASSLVSSTPPLVQYLYTYQWYSSGVARWGSPLRVSPFWGDTILWSETISPLISGEDSFSILIWTKNQPKKLHSGLLVKKIWFHHFGFIIESSFWFREKNEYNNF